MKVEEVRDMNSWNELVLSSKYTSPTHFFTEADVHFKVTSGGEIYLAPFRIIKMYNVKLLVSYGTRADGGLVPLTKFSEISSALNSLKNYLKDRGYDVMNLTFKDFYMKDYVSEIQKILEGKTKYKVTLYARILPLTEGFEHIWKNRFNKKARNLVRKFKKNKGYIEILKNPLEYLDEIMEINLSKTFRQDRLLPPTYTNRELVYENLKLTINEKGNHLNIYGAFINGKLVAYAYIVELNGYAYVSRFLAHAKYFKYAVSNGLLTGIIKDLCEKGVRILQYGYWSRHHEGINHFLKQHGFERGKVTAYYVPLSKTGSIALRILNLRDKIKESSFGEICRKSKLLRKIYHKMFPRI